MVEPQFGLREDLARESRRKHLAELDPPLVEGVDPPDDPLREDAVLVEPDDDPEVTR